MQTLTSGAIMTLTMACPEAVAGYIACDDPKEESFLTRFCDLVTIPYFRYRWYQFQVFMFTFEKDFKFVQFLITERGMSCCVVPA